MQDVRVVSDGSFLIDGGTMFGIVPKAVWSRFARPDAENRVKLGTSCLLFEADGGYVLVEAGLGEALPAGMSCRIPMTGPRLPERLAALNIDPGEVRWVILSHLHFDHAGWIARRAGDGLAPTFPNARHVVQEKELASAAAPPPRMCRSYAPGQWKTISDAGLWQPVDGDAEILDGVSVVRTGGHCEGHQVVLIERGGTRLLFWGDLVATWWHLRPAWTTAYDSRPDEVVRLKLAWIERAAAEGWTVATYHDPTSPLARLHRDGTGAAKARPVGRFAGQATSP